MKKVFFIVITLMSCYAYSGNPTVSGVGVSKVYAGYSHNGVFFDISEDENRNPALCVAGLPRTFVADPSINNVEHLLSVLLYAHASGKIVEVEFYTDQCFQGHRVVRKVAVY